MKKGRKILTLSAITITLLASLSLFFADGKYFAAATFAAAVGCCLPFFAAFEDKKTSTRYVVLVAVLTAVSVAGRFMFAPIPFFKPVSAVVVVSGICLGSHAGFVTGAMSAVVSNFYFGQGPWTPFQMLAWGLIGFFAGVFSKKLSCNKILLSAYGVISAVFYSLVLDSWSAVWIDGAFNPKRFTALFLTSIPVTFCYALSNVAFVLVVGIPLIRSINRIVKKYGIK